MEASANYEDHDAELEAIKCIFMDDLIVLEERPYKFEVLLNANNEADRSHLSLKVTFELPDDYPSIAPNMQIKNLSPDIIDNNMVLNFEKLISTKAAESLGTMMIYEVCEALREKISEMNDLILKKLDALNQKDSIDHGLQKK